MTSPQFRLNTSFVFSFLEELGCTVHANGVYLFNSLAPGRCGNVFKSVIISTHITDQFHEHLLWNSYQMNASEPLWKEVSIDSVNGLVPSGNKPLPEPLLTQISIWRHSATKAKVWFSRWHADFFSEKKKIYMCIFFHCTTLKWHRLLETFLMVDKEHFIIHNQPIPWLLMTWYCKEPGHQQLLHLLLFSHNIFSLPVGLTPDICVTN